MLTTVSRSRCSTATIPNVTEPAPFQRVAVVGLGVMGGSFARALTATRGAPEVRGWCPNADERRAALDAGAVMTAPEALREALHWADLVVLATPLPVVCDLISGIADNGLANEATIMDVAGLKEPVARAAAAAGLSNRFVGAHPMAGSEASGFAASRPDLFDDAIVWVVAEPEADARTTRVEALWRSLGGNPVRTSASEHDRLMSLASQLPQLIANSLAAALNAADIGHDDLGPGGRDMTRLAASNPEMWAPLFEDAHPDLIGTLRTMAASLGHMADDLESGDIDALVSLMKQTQTWRTS